MAVYVIGDIQGCFDTFMALLRRVQFSPKSDRLWLTGDLVNRGPRNLEVLRWVKAHAEVVTTVLGNHDLHLIARHLNVAGPKTRDTLEDVLTAPDRNELISWLRTRPIVYREGQRLLVHAGLLPQWTAAEAEVLAREIEAALQSDEAGSLLQFRMHQPQTVAWSSELVGLPRLATALRALTNLRVCTEEGLPDYAFSDAPAVAPAGYEPWFAWQARRSQDLDIFFGHWSALGFYQGARVTALDSGCVWGQQLTALRLEDQAVFSEPSQERLISKNQDHSLG